MYCELVEFHNMLLFTRMFKCTMSGCSVYIIFPCDLFHAQEPAVASVPSRLSFFFTSLLRDYHLTSWNSNQALKTGGRYRNCQWMFSFCLNYWNEKWFVLIPLTGCICFELYFWGFLVLHPVWDVRFCGRRLHCSVVCWRSSDTVWSPDGRRMYQV